MGTKHIELGCDCGYIIRGATAEEVAAGAGEHALEAHGMTFSREQLLGRAERARERAQRADKKGARK